MRVVSRGELRAILRAHADDPDAYTGLRYYELRQIIGRSDWEKLDEEHQGWYIPNIDRLNVVDGEGNANERGVVIDYVLQPGSYDAWVVETP